MPILTRIGACNHCGKCCLREGGLMVENPMIELHEDRCKFYVNEVSGHCLIYRRNTKPIEDVKDRLGNKITDKQIKWFNENCVRYPIVRDAEAGCKLLPGCGFSFKVI